LTGFGQEQNKEKATRAGFDAHLMKPADEAALAGIFADPSRARPSSEGSPVARELSRERPTK
jgi:CheY-like chemotaxis protein